ncbi:MAG: hypothetical protein HQK53_15250 [Oligoflexia bacterium]|nr:hypothetical protein [Oligoflexia bacterium]
MKNVMSSFYLFVFFISLVPTLKTFAWDAAEHIQITSEAFKMLQEKTLLSAVNENVFQIVAQNTALPDSSEDLQMCYLTYKLGRVVQVCTPSYTFKLAFIPIKYPNAPNVSTLEHFYDATTATGLSFENEPNRFIKYMLDVISKPLPRFPRFMNQYETSIVDADGRRCLINSCQFKSAFDKASEYLDLILSNKDRVKNRYNLGYFLHYIQEVTNPYHASNITKKMLIAGEMIDHQEYEKMATGMVRDRVLRKQRAQISSYYQSYLELFEKDKNLLSLFHQVALDSHRQSGDAKSNLELSEDISTNLARGVAVTMIVLKQLENSY